MSHHNHPQKFAIPQFKEFVPEAIRPWIILAFVIVIQFSGGVYLSAVSEMTGSTQLLQEDIMMAGYASLAGMALFFAIMFRLKCAVRPKTTLTTCLLVIIAANLICMHTRSVPVLVITCLIAGFFRMWGTFECNSTIQLWLTPKRDMSVFFSFVYILVNGSIQLSGTATVLWSVWSSWHYMHWFIIILLAIVYMLVLLLYKGIAIMPRIPLLGIDWLGMIMWGLWAMCILFICVYGEHYDWWRSEEIGMATAFAVILLALNLIRASFIRHPYILLKTFAFPIVPISIGVMIVADVLLAPSHIFEHMLMEGILGYDALNIVSLNWIALAGVVAGVFFTWRKFAIKKWSYQRMLSIAFSCVTAYLAYFYFMLDYNLPKEALYFPIFIRSAGYVIIAISLLTALTRLPFPHHFTQGVATQNMFSAALAGPIGAAVVGRMLTVATARNAMEISQAFDGTNAASNQLPLGQIYGTVQVQALMESMKEVYGWLLVLGIVCLIGLTLRYSDIRPVKVIHPTYRAINNMIRGEFKLKRPKLSNLLRR